ncbi:hypothetical protein J4209_06465 [Candidatus Woesearchaeota archaeon]|nr:hypothetical protein [Candidatus Woesearchaeota archaeon]
MNFDNDKKCFLRKIDKSKKGSVDKAIKPLVNKINSLKNYYTTSSCAGRVLLLIRRGKKKHETEWLFAKHGKVSFNELKKALRRLPKQDVWFKEEASIFHISCRTIDDAQKLVNLTRNIGFRRTGIQSIKRKIVVEIVSTENIETIAAKSGKIIVDDDYLKVLAEEANKKMKRNKEKIGFFYKGLSCL